MTLLALAKINYKFLNQHTTTTCHFTQSTVMGARQRTNSITAIFFDLDNTLIQTRKADKLACNKLSEILWEKYAVPRDVSTTICGNYLRSFRKCPENPQMDLDKWRHLLWTQALGAQYHSLAGDVYLKWLHLRYHYLALPSETLLLLKNLKKNYLLGLITNGPSCAQWEKIERLKLHSYFDIILVSGDLPWEKPNQQIFQEACDHLKVEPKQCLMVGDKLETDILGGIQAKLGGTVWIPLASEDLDEEKQCQPDYVIDTVAELPGLLQKHARVPENTWKEAYTNKHIDIFDSNSNASDGS